MGGWCAWIRAQRSIQAGQPPTCTQHSPSTENAPSPARSRGAPTPDLQKTKNAKKSVQKEGETRRSLWAAPSLPPYPRALTKNSSLWVPRRRNRRTASAPADPCPSPTRKEWG